MGNDGGKEDIMCYSPSLSWFMRTLDYLCRNIALRFEGSVMKMLPLHLLNQEGGWKVWIIINLIRFMQVIEANGFAMVFKWIGQ